MTDDDRYEFDVFISYRHNPNDKPYVVQLVEVLEDVGLRVWFDEHCLRPGVPWVRGLERGVERSASGLVLLGDDKVGPWQSEEVDALLQNAVRRKIPLIPVFLQSMVDSVELPAFLEIRKAVDLRHGYTPENVAALRWGITGERHQPLPLPRSASDLTSDDYVRRRGHLIHKLKAKDSTGRWAYYFLLVEPRREKAFLDCLDGPGIVDLETYGSIVASCYGEEPSKEVKDYLREKYGFRI